MGLHTLTPQPTAGIGHKVEKLVHGLGAIKDTLYVAVYGILLIVAVPEVAA